MLALMANYLCSALFHDLTLLPSQQLLLFAFAGLTAALQQQSVVGLTYDGCRNVFTSLSVSGARSVVNRGTVATSGDTRRVKLFGMQIEHITLNEAVARVLGWCGRTGERCRYVVTPNVDHAVLFQDRSDLQAAYADASLVLADGAPIVLASRLLRRPLPERVAGSDLVPAIFRSTTDGLRVYLLGAAPGVAESAAANIEREWRNVKVVGTYSPPLGFESDDAENARILDRIAAVRPDIVIVGFGAPKQELWVHRHCQEMQAKVVLCAGATIDFLAGHRRRSPVWMRRAGLEWLHRVWTEPGRLGSRYARDAWVFPQLVWRELQSQ
jgi:N-acetylglucosaminyldiphosphoundecaprenol N-acetyl-beta-D-mannosaminyltransferase